ncbi:Gfo/Idh/MocA family protein [Parathalassolituus penaei]|uniref:Gfo/Idh/MocA family oxidoreductase n=1 Tax=Parathalassolituus penaei TaxID=2997323 RepID=A0A9X3EGM5_9GAMM|nr:Gfo/Idh/MocA family oxidoreductase [Parathalassolituus penaei]MCY0967217.1 Gfo/Idh/MocA family oxidoreductase [Parathalassolituus penaei]
MNPVAIALVGTGAMAAACLERIRRCPDTELVARVGAEPELASPEVSLYANLEECLADPAVEAVVLAVSGEQQLAMALLCVAAGKALLLEKPGYLDLQDAAILEHALQVRAVPCLPGYYRLHSPVYQVARKTLGNGLLGRVASVQGQWRFFAPSDFHRAAEWRTARFPLPLADHLAHEIACLRYLLGEVTEVRTLQAQDQHSGSRCICLRFESGVLGTLMLSDLDGNGDDSPCYQDEDLCVITGSEGSLSLPDMTLRRYGLRQSGEDWSPFTSSQLDVKRRDPLMEQLRHFCRVVRGEQEAMLDMAWAIRNLRVVEALLVACRTGEPEPVASQRNKGEMLNWLRSTAAPMAAVSW